MGPPENSTSNSADDGDGVRTYSHPPGLRYTESARGGGVLPRPPEGRAENSLEQITAIERHLVGDSARISTGRWSGARGSLTRALGTTPRRTVMILVGDVLAMLAAGATLALHPGLPPLEPRLLVGSVAMYLSALHVAGLYSIDLRRVGLWTYASRLCLAFAVSLLLLLPIVLLLWLGAPRVLWKTILALGYVAGWRLFAEAVMVPRLPPIRALVVGAGAAARDLLVELRSHPDYDVVGLFDDDPERWGSEVGGMPVLGGAEALPDLVLSEGVSLVIVAITRERRPELIDQLVACQYAGVPVLDLPNAFELISSRLPVEHVTPSWIAFSADMLRNHSSFALRFKRLVDIVVAAGGLTLSAPLVAVACVLIRLDTPGPAFYRQARVGRHGREFQIVKLRTMRRDAEANGAAWATASDPRVTRVGRVLRWSRLDEAPQFWNVLVGDMSMVGPRPERPEFVHHLRELVPHYPWRHAMRPGITGWAQVRFPYGASAAEALRKLEYDLFYVRNFSMLFDLRILWMTVGVVVAGRGSR